MLPDALKQKLETRIGAVEHPRELAIDVINALQDHYGYFSDEAVEQAAGLLGMTTLEIEELATFYTFIYREPVGRYVIHVCDSLICWMEGEENLLAHLLKTLGIGMGETTADGLFTVLPVCCIGYCDRAPAILVNRRAYGPLTIEAMDQLIEKFRRNAS
jgi:NADH-quinone oxidoreductase subunit E